MNTFCPLKHVPSAARFFTLCRLTVQPPQSYSVGGQRSSGQLTGKPAGALPDYRVREPLRMSGNLGDGAPLGMSGYLKDGVPPRVCRVSSKTVAPLLFVRSPQRWNPPSIMLGFKEAQEVRAPPFQAQDVRAPPSGVLEMAGSGPLPRTTLQHPPLDPGSTPLHTGGPRKGSPP
ncbi:UNVERIFIED_CONTAM: hypothetical protein FKN15_025925 [Acipenser sinensis]